MEDDLKILKVEYLSNHWLDVTQIWNLSLGDQTTLATGRICLGQPTFKML